MIQLIYIEQKHIEQKQNFCVVGYSMGGNLAILLSVFDARISSVVACVPPINLPAKGIEQFPLTEAANKGQFMYYYTCGLVFHSVVDKALKEKKDGKNAFSLWLDYREGVKTGILESGEAGYLTMLETEISEELSQRLRALIGIKSANGKTFIEGLYTKLSVNK